jgi:hypothetical protein
MGFGNLALTQAYLESLKSVTAKFADKGMEEKKS